MRRNSYTTLLITQLVLLLGCGENQGKIVEPAGDADRDADACHSSVDVSLSPYIPTVVLVTWSDAQAWDEAKFEYWSQDEEMHETPLASASTGSSAVVGLRPDTVYEYRVTADRDGETCVSRTKELRTGSAPELLPRPTVTVSRASDVNPGYLLTTPQSREEGASGYVVIYDHQGVPVWWYRTSLPALISRAHFSWDGSYVVARDTNPLGKDGGRIVRVPLDGSREDSIEINGSHHDFTPVADGFLFLVGGGEDECGTIQHWSDAGDLTEVYALRDAFGETFKAGAVNPCHCNSIDYNADDDSISVSCLNQNAFVKISSSGQLIWVLGGNNGQSHFTGDVKWERQHGHHLLTPSRLLFFNNMGGGDSEDTDSLAVELQLDLEQRTARRVWEYASGAVSGILGDVQYATNGNVLVTYSDTGEFHEVNSAGQLVQRWGFPSAVGYSHQQPRLGQHP